MSDDTPFVTRTVTHTDQLPELIAALQASPFVTLDTEFMRETTYWPQLCLIQLATPGTIWLIDPLADIDLSTFWQALTTADCPVILHAAEQDLELIHLACGRLPRQLFDTQIAATLLGQGEQAGYANLVERLLGEHLDKSQSRTDWCRRPLSAKQRDYAADDVRHLYRLYPLMRDQLQQRGRLDWLDADFRALSDPSRFEINDERLWLRVRGQQRLRGNALAVLQSLTIWREERARQLNRPRRWVLADDLLVDLARNPPTNARELAERRGWPKGMSESDREAILTRMNDAREMPSQDWPQRPEIRRASAREEGILAVLQTATRLIAQEQEIATSLLATTDDLLRFLRQPDDPGSLTQGWRSHIIGEPLRAVLRGEVTIAIVDDRATLTAAG